MLVALCLKEPIVPGVAVPVLSSQCNLAACYVEVLPFMSVSCCVALG